MFHSDFLLKWVNLDRSYYASIRMCVPHEHRNTQALSHASLFDNSLFLVVIRKECCLLYPVICGTRLSPILSNPGNVHFLYKSCFKSSSQTSSTAIKLHHFFLNSWIRAMHFFMLYFSLLGILLSPFQRTLSGNFPRSVGMLEVFA